MTALTDPRIQVLQKRAEPSGELNHPLGDRCFRMNLRDDNITLWQETFEKLPYPSNLLLACERSDGALGQTRLTWVVGSAIRGTTAKGAGAVADLLKELDVPAELTAAAVERCPGLGEDLVWAFYLERHGWLIATPVAQTQQP